MFLGTQLACRMSHGAQLRRRTLELTESLPSSSFPCRKKVEILSENVDTITSKSETPPTSYLWTFISDYFNGKEMLGYTGANLVYHDKSASPYDEEDALFTTYDQAPLGLEFFTERDHYHDTMETTSTVATDDYYQYPAVTDDYYQYPAVTDDYYQYPAVTDDYYQYVDATEDFYADISTSSVQSENFSISEFPTSILLLMRFILADLLEYESKSFSSSDRETYFLDGGVSIPMNSS